MNQIMHHRVVFILLSEEQLAIQFHSLEIKCRRLDQIKANKWVDGIKTEIK
jgi:stress-induced morphogen